MKLLIIIFCYLLNADFSSGLPSYISQCSLTSLSLNDCIAESANKVIPHLVKGDDDFGVPVLSPVYIPNTTLRAKNLKLSISNAYGYGLENVKIVSAGFDVQNRKGTITGRVDQLRIEAEYSIEDSEILNRTIFGNGHLNVTFVGNKFVYRCDVLFYQKDLEIYINATNSELDFTTGRAYFSFENLQSAEKDDINALIDKNWEIMLDELKPSVEGFLLECIRSSLRAFSRKLPLRKLYLP